MKVIMSTGHGRLHFIEAGNAIAQKNIGVTIVTGWLPKRTDSFMVKILSKLIHYNIAPGMKKRMAFSEQIKVESCAFSEFFSQAMLRLLRPWQDFRSFVHVLAWRLFGWQSRKVIQNADVFHVRSGAGHGGAIRKARRLGMKIVVDHSIAHPDYLARELEFEYRKNKAYFTMSKSSRFWRMILEDCQMSDVVVVNSDFVKETFVNEGFPVDKVKVVYWGIPSNFFGVRSRMFEKDTRVNRLLFTGTFGFRKGAEYLLNAVKVLREHNRHFTMNVVGSVEINEPWRQLCKDYDVNLTGCIPQDDLKDVFRHSDIYVFPSLAEGCARSGVEAMGAGLCVVATKESGLPIVDGETGLIVPVRDSVAIVEKIEWLLDHPGIVHRIGKNAADYIAKNLTWDAYARGIEVVYSDLVAGTCSASKN